MSDKKYCYDIEVFPNFFCATFLNIVDNLDKKVFVIFNKVNHTKKLLKFLSTENLVLIGFNNYIYDGAILHFIKYLYESDNFISTSELNNQIYNFSTDVISTADRMNFDGEIYKHQNSTDISYRQIDLMKINAYDKLGVSLKQISINLKWYKIQDLPLPYDHIVKVEECSLILDYNLNDVLITQELYKSLTPQLELREKLSVEYNVDLMSASDSKMANVILEDMYCSMLNVSPKDIRNLRTKRESISLKDCLGKGIEFKTNVLQRIKREIEGKIVYKEDNFKYNKTVKFAGVEYELGIGGLHSVDGPAIYLSDENTTLIDSDVSSYYPSIMINNNLYPEHLDPKFVDILKKITVERLSAKKSGNKIKADSLKITVNSIFGKLGSDTFWLYDPMKLLSVTVSGQLYLLMLIESFVLAGIEVISANTDGVLSRIPKNLISKHKEICDWWQEVTGFGLEHTEYSGYFRNDVNNYITLKPDNHTKEKGRYLMGVDLKKGYRHPIVPKALYEYFIHKTPIMDTIMSCNDILDYCISQKTGGEFVLEFRENTPDSQEQKVNKLQKNNRFYISNSGGSLVKKNQIKSNEIGLYVGSLVHILNDYDPTIPITEYDINYDFYIEEAYKYITEVEKNINCSSTSFVDEPENYVSEEDIVDIKKQNISIKFKGMKGLPDRVICNLMNISDKFNGSDFLDLLVFCEENNYMSIKYRDIIKLNYFEKYGHAKKLLKLFDEFNKGKNKYSKTLAEKTKINRLAELKLFFDFINDKDVFTIKEQITNEVELLGEVKSKFDINKGYCYVSSIETKYTPKINIYNLSTGNKLTLKISKPIFEMYPMSEGDIILTKNFNKKQSMKKDINGNWEKTDNFEWWLTVYYIMKPEDEFI